MASPSTHQWFKSTYSGGSGTECVECALTVDGALLRDSKSAYGPAVAVRRLAWNAFIEALQVGAMPKAEN
ncbi:DUF397 domain-containing protein [Streptomyces sp. NPDC058751]|uniref:DUF397 domain-containing protein n=1 Tax=Streptomyces sp. NPDC058751 TaxID=3346623 RepID=UPI00367B1656